MPAVLNYGCGLVYGAVILLQAPCYKCKVNMATWGETNQVHLKLESVDQETNSKQSKLIHYCLLKWQSQEMITGHGRGKKRIMVMRFG